MSKYEQEIQTTPGRDEKLTAWMLHFNECGMRTVVMDFIVKVRTEKEWLDVDGPSFIAACKDYERRQRAA